MKNTIYITAGILCVGLGLVGVFLPILPTTPFLLLASFLFLNSSKTLHAKLKNHSLLGPYIVDYEEKRGVKKSMKTKAYILLWLSILLSAYLVSLIWVKVVLVLIAVGVTLYISSLKTL